MKLKLADKLELPPSVITQKLAIVAESGAGKTYTAGVLAEQMLGVGAQVIIIEPVGVWWGLQAGADGKSPGFGILVMGGDHANLPLTPESGELVGRLLAERGVSAVLDVSGFTTSETKRFVRDWAEAFFQAKKQHKTPVHIIFEEAQTFVPQYPEKDETVMLNRLERLLKIGRNYGVGWTLVTQQPQSVHKRILNLAGTLIALRTSGRHERKALSDWATSNADPKDVDLVGDLPGLETGEAHVWSPSFLKMSKRVHIAKKTTFDASATPEVGQEYREPKALAPVELEQLRTAMATVVTAAEAEDPKALQKKVAELTKQLAAKPSTTVEVRTIEKPVSIKEELEQLGRALEAMRQLGDALAQKQQVVVTALGNARTLLEPTRAAAGIPVAAKLRSIEPASRIPVSPGARTTGPGEIKRPAREMLRELAALHPGSLTRRALATRAVLRGSNGNFRNLVSSLRMAGFVEDDEAGDLRATAAGVAASGPQKPKDVAEIVALWHPKLKPRVRTMLSTLLELGPGQGLNRAELAEAAGIEAATGNFRNLLSTLRTSGLVDERGGRFHASQALYLSEAA